MLMVFLALRTGDRYDRPTDRHPRGFPCWTIQAVVKPPSGADAHTYPPVSPFEHSQSGRGAEVAGCCRMASFHHPRAHEKPHVSASRLIVPQTSRASHLVLRVGRGLWSRLTYEQDDAGLGGVYPAFASELLKLRDGRAQVRREARQNVVWWGWWPAKSNVSDGGVARRLGLLFPRPNNVRIACGRILELGLGSSAKGIQVGRSGGRYAKGGWKS